MKTDTVRALTTAAADIVRRIDDADTPVIISVSYLDLAGRAVTATHVVGVPGWTMTKK